MKSLMELDLFKISNSSNKELQKKLTDVNMKRDKLDLSEIEGNLSTIKRRFKYAYKSKALQDTVDENVVFLYNKETVDIPVFLPFFLMNNDGKVVTAVNLTPYGRYDRDENFIVDNRLLFSLMQSASLTREMYFDFNKVKNNTKIVKNTVQAFSKLVGKLLDRHFAINLNQTVTDYIYYVTAKYFLVNVFERDLSKSVDDLAYQATFNGTTRSGIENFEEGLPEDTFESIEGYINALSTIEGLDDVSMRFFLNEWMNTYHESTAFALEYLPYFFNMIFSAMLTAHMNNEFLIDSILEKETTTIYNELSRILE